MLEVLTIAYGQCGVNGSDAKDGIAPRRQIVRVTVFWSQKLDKTIIYF